MPSRLPGLARTAVDVLQLRATVLMQRPYLPIAVGFYLLGLPLLGVAAFVKTRAESWTHLLVGGVLIAIGLVLHRRAT